MSSQENRNMAPMSGAPMTPPANMPQKPQPPAYPQPSAQPGVQAASTYGAVYPEVYYKLRPFILMECDIINAYGIAVPSQQQIEQISDRIFEHACQMYPDMADYLRKYDAPQDDPSDPPFPRGGFGRGFGFGGFRRRGLGRDLITALLLAELFGRRRY